jgi:hypothetical protein
MIQWIQDYRCGLHSGIPKCCIRYFVNEWFHVPLGLRIRITHSERLGGTPDYIMCDACWLDASVKPIKLKGCDCNYRRSLKIEVKDREPCGDDRIAYFNKESHFLQWVAYSRKDTVPPPNGATKTLILPPLRAARWP